MTYRTARALYKVVDGELWSTPILPDGSVDEFDWDKKYGSDEEIGLARRALTSAG